jgi:hypothetical protein
MAQLQRIAPAQANINPEIGRDGHFIQRGFERLADTLNGLADESRKQQDALDYTKLSGDYEFKLDALKDELATEPDYQKRIDQYNQLALDLQSKTLDLSPNKEVSQALNVHIGRVLPNKALAYKRDTLKEWGQARVAELDQQEEILAEKVVTAATPEEADRYRGMQRGLAMGLSQGPGAPLNPLELQKRIKGFEIKSLEKYATKILRSNPDAMQTDEVVSRLSGLGEARLLTLQSQARDESHKREAWSDQVMQKNKKEVMNAAEAKANFAQLDPAWLDQAMKGELAPMITAADGRHLKSINDNPASGAADKQVQAIMSEYYLNPAGRTPNAIRATRERLNRLQRDLGAPSKALNAAANELQSDQTTLENQGIAREANAIAADNRAIHNLKTEYDAWVQVNPIIKDLMGNLAPSQKAQIESIYRSKDGGPEAAKKKLEEFKKGITAKEQAVPNATKKVKDF